jgi:hypothetical protein
MQRIVMDGNQIPLAFCNGLPYLQCWVPTANEIDSLPHLIMTADVDWGPTACDNTITDLSKFYDKAVDDVTYGPFDDKGNYRHQTFSTHDTMQIEPEYFDVHE